MKFIRATSIFCLAIFTSCSTEKELQGATKQLDFSP